VPTRPSSRRGATSTATPPEPRLSLQQAVLFAVLTAVLYLALVICAWGFISLLAGVDVVAQPVGPLVAALIPAVSTAIVLVAVLFRMRDRQPRLAWLPAALSAASVYLGAPLVAASVLAFDRVDAAAGLLFFAERVTGPFVPAAAVLAGVMVLVAPLVRRIPPPHDPREDSADGGNDPTPFDRPGNPK
jgi:hypothetical protein